MRINAKTILMREIARHVSSIQKEGTAFIEYVLNIYIMIDQWTFMKEINQTIILLEPAPPGINFV